MAFELVPFPIAILFIFVFALAWIVVLYKLRRRGKVYSILYKASLIIGIASIIILLSAVIQRLMS